MLNELLAKVATLEQQLEEQRIKLEIHNKLSWATTLEELNAMPSVAREVARDRGLYRVLGFLAPTTSGNHLGIGREGFISLLIREGYIAEDRTPLKHSELMMHVREFDSEGVLWHAYHPKLLDMVADKVPKREPKEEKPKKESASSSDLPYDL